MCKLWLVAGIISVFATVVILYLRVKETSSAQTHSIMLLQAHPQQFNPSHTTHSAGIIGTTSTATVNTITRAADLSDNTALLCEYTSLSVAIDSQGVCAQVAQSKVWHDY